jgi:hypothetical protein
VDWCCCLAHLLIDLSQTTHSDLIKLEQEQRGGSGDTGGGTGVSSSPPAGAGQGGLVSRSEERMRRLVRRSVARGLSMVGLGFWVSPHTWRQWDRLCFQTTHRLLLGEEGRLRSARFTPVLVDFISMWMNWPVLLRRTGELPSSPQPPAPAPPSPALGGRSVSSPGRAR